MQEQKQQQIQQPAYSGEPQQIQQQQVEQQKQQEQRKPRRELEKAHGEQEQEKVIEEENDEDQEQANLEEAILLSEPKQQSPVPATARKTPGHVTRVVGDLMVFAQVSEEGAPFGLVFMPDVIVNYHGERLQDIGIVVGAPISEIDWDIATRLVSSVVIGFRELHRHATAF